MARKRLCAWRQPADDGGFSLCTAARAVLLCCLSAMVAGTAAQPPTPPTSLSAGYTVSSSATLAGLSAATFGPSAQAGFSSAMASSLKVDAVALAVTGVTDVARRRLLGSGATVAFTVSVSSASAATDVASGITAVAADSSAFVSALNTNLMAEGLPACLGVAISAPVVAAPPALNLSGIDVSAAVSAVASSFDNLSDSAAIEKQTQMLISLATGTANATFSEEGASAAASLVLAVVSATPGVALSNVSQTAALDILGAVASTRIDATSGVGQTIVSALDSVASSAVSIGNLAALAAVQSVIDNLASSQAASLLENMDLTPGAPPPAPATTSTPSIQTLVQVDPPGSDRLTTQPLTAPGSASAFEPMPAGLLPTSSPVVTQFFSLKFGASANGYRGPCARADRRAWLHRSQRRQDGGRSREQQRRDACVPRMNIALCVRVLTCVRYPFCRCRPGFHRRQRQPRAGG